MRLLLVEDEERLASFLTKGLRSRGYVVERVATAAHAIAKISSGLSDLVILDLGLPDADGFEVLQAMRAAGVRTPVIILTARGGLADKVRGLDLGADDYVPKPVAFDELLARIRARLRPRDDLPASVLRAGSVQADLLTRLVTVGDRPVDLTAREFALMETFLRHAGQVLSREQILSQVWGLDFDPGTNLVDVYVGYLRRKIGEAFIQTIRGVGYRLSSNDRDSADRDTGEGDSARSGSA